MLQGALLDFSHSHLSFPHYLQIQLANNNNAFVCSTAGRNHETPSQLAYTNYFA